MARPREITPELRARMSAMLAEGMPYTEVATAVGRSEFFVRKYCRGESRWDCVAAGRWTAVVARQANILRGNP